MCGYLLDAETPKKQAIMHSLWPRSLGSAPSAVLVVAGQAPFQPPGGGEQIGGKVSCHSFRLPHGRTKPTYLFVCSLRGQPLQHKLLRVAKIEVGARMWVKMILQRSRRKTAGDLPEDLRRRPA